MLRQPLFSVFLSDSDEEKSEITFGAIKQETDTAAAVVAAQVPQQSETCQEHMASELYWVNVVGDAGYWQAHALSFE